MIGVSKQVRRRVLVPIRKIIRDRRIDWGIKLVRSRVRVPVIKLNKGKRIDWGIELVRS